MSDTLVTPVCPAVPHLGPGTAGQAANVTTGPGTSSGTSSGTNRLLSLAQAVLQRDKQRDKEADKLEILSQGGRDKERDSGTKSGLAPALVPGPRAEALGAAPEAPRQGQVSATASSAAHDLEGLGADAFEVATCSHKGRVVARYRLPDGRWSPPLAVGGTDLPLRPPAFLAPEAWWSPDRCGWCIGCNGPSKWRSDAPAAPGPSLHRWRCVRCQPEPARA